MNTKSAPLHALTVCLHYSDYFRETLRNKAHFESWTVVTCENDRETKDLCGKEGIKIVESRYTGPDGIGFDSAFAKAPLINEALAGMPTDGWVVILDADVLLPKHFRKRLDSYELYPRALYGLYGRRGCDTWEEYEWRRGLEPWTQDLGWHPNILGYFQMFRLDQVNNRYPLRKINPEMHDDIAFQYLFKPQLRRLLPMTCLHVGPPQVNWGGRTSVDFRLNEGAGYGSRAWPDPVTAVPEALGRNGRFRTMIVIGMDPTTPIAAYAGLADRVIVIDWHGLHRRGLAGIGDQDAVAQLELWEAARTGLDNVSEHTDLSEDILLTLIGGAHPDCIVFDIEMRIDVMSQWTQLLKKPSDLSCRIVGRFYGFPKWRETTLAINLLLGAPESVHRDGSWTVSVKIGGAAVPRLGHALPRLRMPLGRDITVWLLVQRREDLEILTRWLFCPLADWNGRIGIIDTTQSKELEILREVCGLQVESCAPAPSWAGDEEVSAHALSVMMGKSPGEIVIIDLATASPDDLWEAAAWRGEGMFLSVATRWKSVKSRSCREFAHDLGKITENRPGQEALKGMPGRWKAAACGKNSQEFRNWCKKAFLATEARLSRPVASALCAVILEGKGNWSFSHKAEARGGSWDIPPEQLRRIGGLLAPVVRAPVKSLIMVAVPSSEAELFAACAPTWRFHDTVPTVVVATAAVVNFLRDTITGVRWLVPDSNQFHGRSDGLKHEEGRETMENAALQMLRTGNDEWDHLIVLRADLHPAPGATLFAGAPADAADLECEVDFPSGRRGRRAGRKITRFSTAGPWLISRRLYGAFLNSGHARSGGGPWRRELFDFAQSHGFDVRTRHPFASGWLSNKAS